MVGMVAVVRPPAVAGSFYPSRPDALRRMVEASLLDAEARLPEDAPDPKALILPHAGYVYSGPTAALGYVLAGRRRGEIERVVLLGPCHRVWVDGLALSGASAFATPLGDVRVEAPDSTLDALPQLITSPEAHAGEHSLEVHLPFVQIVLGDVAALPIAVGGASPAEVAEVLDAAWGGPETLVVISSDLSHYLPQPRAEDADAQTIDQILRLDGPLPPRRACGAGPVNGLLATAARRGLTPTLLGSCTSGDPTVLRRDTDPSRVVGYAAIAFA